MGRLSPRIQRDIKAKLLAPNGREYAAILGNLGLGGACLKPAKGMPRISKGLAHPYHLNLSNSSLEGMTLTAQTVWRNNHRQGLRFLGLNDGVLLKIWDYMRPLLISRVEKCPYCHCSLESSDKTCAHCGWDLHFGDKNYFQYWQRESLLRQLHETWHDLSKDAFQKIARYLRKEALDRDEQAAVDETEEYVGTCEKTREVFKLIRKVAPTDLPVLILGESGTGKDLTARAIHERSPRHDQPYVAINCSAIPSQLVEAELFGYAKGAFTGAYQAKKGKFEYADQGTIFLDEIGELPLELQPKLLRVLEDQKVVRIGSLKSRLVDVRMITATNMNIEKAVAKGRFRRDLYHRIKVFTISLPPLRDRGEDKTILAKYFLKKISAERDWNCRGFTPEALESIRHHPWPGNVREMINRIRRAVVMQEGHIRPEDLELAPMKPAMHASSFKEAASKLKKELIVSSLREHQYNVSQTARSLGLSRPYLYSIMKRFSIQLNRNEHISE